MQAVGKPLIATPRLGAPSPSPTWGWVRRPTPPQCGFATPLAWASLMACLFGLLGCDADPTEQTDAGVRVCAEGKRYHLGAGPYSPTVTDGVPTDTQPALAFDADVQFLGTEDGIARWMPAGPPIRLSDDLLAVGGVYHLTHTYTFADERPFWTTQILTDAGDLVLLAAHGDLTTVRDTLRDAGFPLTWVPDCTYDGPAGCFTPNVHMVAALGPEADPHTLVPAQRETRWTQGDTTYAVFLEGAVDGQGEGRLCSGVPTSQAWITLRRADGAVGEPNPGEL